MEAIVQPVYTGRAPVIIALGIIAFLFLGPLTGVPAWIMARQDLRDCEAGLIPSSSHQSLKTARWIAIAGTFLSPIWLFCFAVIAFVFLEMTFTMLSFL